MLFASCIVKSETHCYEAKPLAKAGGFLLNRRAI